MAPPITEATQNARSNPDAVETAAAIGVSRVMVPTEVPIATDTKQATINSTDTENLAGIRLSIQYATLSALLLPTTPTKEPAARKIRSMVMIFCPHSLCHDLQFFIKIQCSVLQTGNQDCSKKCYYDRHIIKSHGDFHHILK